MVTKFQSLLLLLLTLLCFSLEPAQGQVLVSRGKSKVTKPWTKVNIAGQDYIQLANLMSFYKFKRMTNPKRKSYITYGSKNMYISMRAGQKDFYVNNYRYILSYPIMRHGNDLLISTVDIRKLVDPVLRPSYSRDAGKVTTIVIDPGHGGHDAGAVSQYGREKDCNLALALKLRALLNKQGFNVVMTRANDIFLTLQQRVNIANRYPNSIFVSIHHNSASRASASGIETFTLAPVGTNSPFARRRLSHELQGNNQDSENIALATAIHSYSIAATKAIDRGIQRARFSVLCNIKRPAVLFEGGFVKHPVEGPKIFNDSYQNKLAKALCEGILGYCHTVGGHTQKTRLIKTSSGSGGVIHGSRKYTGTTRLR